MQKCRRLLAVLVVSPEDDAGLVHDVLHGQGEVAPLQSEAENEPSEATNGAECQNRFVGEVLVQDVGDHAADPALGTVKG